MSDFAWANRDFLTISAVFQAIDLWAYATNEKYNWKTRGGSRKNIFVPFAPTGGNVLQYKASYRIFNLECKTSFFSPMQVICSRGLWVFVSQLKFYQHSLYSRTAEKPGSCGCCCSPQGCTLYFGAFQGAPNRCDQIHMEGASHVSPGISIVGIETVVEKLDKRWQKMRRWVYSISVDLAVFRVGPWDVVQNCVETCWCLIFCMPRDW